jgi:hypothetical protein
MKSSTHFAYTFVQSTDRATFRGQISARRATGTLRESYKSGGCVCRSGLVAFAARRG